MINRELTSIKYWFHNEHGPEVKKVADRLINDKGYKILSEVTAITNST